MEIGVLGTSIWQQNLRLLERLTIDRERRADVLAGIKAALGVDELVYVATCNRVEFIYATSNENARGGRLLHRLIDCFFHDGRDIGFFPNDFYHYTGREAVMHVFRAASALESLVLGETQITGQMKQAHEDARTNRLTGPVLERLIREALTAAKAVRRETSLGKGFVSMASLAARQVKAKLREIECPRIALVGSGSMTLKMAKYLRSSSSIDLLFVNRTLEKAERLASEFGGSALALDEFMAAPGAVNAIVSSTAAPHTVFEAAFIDRVEVSDAPLVCIDLAIPRDFASEYARDERVDLTDIPALKALGQGNLRQKFVEASKANEIVRDAVNQYISGQIEGSLKPIFHRSYEESLALAQEALDDLFRTRVTSLEAKEQEAVMRLVTKLIGHSSFQPARLLSSRLGELRDELSLCEVGERRKAAV